MQPKITRVKWSAVNIPWGVVFDELTGTFTGRPDDIGEYTIPVTVETNYGIDTKNVKMQVVSPTPPVYSVYAIGSNALTWSGNAEADEYGFRVLNIPQAYRLAQHYRGFGAKTPDGKYYYCGIYNFSLGSTYGSVSNNVVPPIRIKNVPARDPIDGLEQTIVGLAQGKINSFDYAFEERYFYVKRYSDGRLEASACHRHYNETTTSGYVERWQNNTEYWKYSFNYCYRLEEGEFSYVNCASGDTDSKMGFPYLRNDGTYVAQSTRLLNFGTGYYEGELGFRAIKRFSPIALQLRHRKSASMVLEYPVFQHLSEDKLLDNNPENFTQGTIQDAWVSGNMAFVATEDGKFYSHDTLSKTWNMQGITNVKKMEFHDNNRIAFLLTENGELYHKGSAVSEVTDEHETFTRIFSELTFKDFTFGGNTLTVLRE